MRGGQWQAFYLLRGLLAAGHRVRLLAPAGSPLLEAALAQNMDARPLHLRSIAASGADLIHAHDARAHSLAVLFSKPVVVSRRVAFPVRRGFASRWKYKRAAHYIAVSRFVRDVLLDAGVPADKISVVYDGVPIGARREAGERTQVIALDSDDPGKGKKIVEEAAALADIPVHFSTNLLRDLAAAAVLVYISDLEGLGSAALLAMAAGVPVIASRTGGLAEIVEDGATGLLTSNDPSDIARTLQRLLGDRTLASQIASRARTRVEREFSTDRMVSETLRVYERMLS